MGASEFHVTGVGPESEEEEEGGEDVLTFGDPGNRFYVQRMPGEECGNEGALECNEGPRWLMVAGI